MSHRGSWVLSTLPAAIQTQSSQTQSLSLIQQHLDASIAVENEPRIRHYIRLLRIHIRQERFHIPSLQSRQIFDGTQKKDEKKKNNGEFCSCMEVLFGALGGTRDRHSGCGLWTVGVAVAFAQEGSRPNIVDCGLESFVSRV